MEKAEILKKAQSKKDDEYITKVESDGRMYGMYAMNIVCCTLFLYFSFYDYDASIRIMNDDVPMRVVSIFPYLLSDSIYCLYRYIKLKEKKRLLWGGFTLILLLGVVIKTLMA